MKSKAVVLLSGGLDSATTLGIANREGHECYCLSLDYGQRHRVELEAAVRVARMLSAREHRMMALDLARFGGSALTDHSIAVPEKPGEGVPITYVPARNTVMLSLALAWSEVLGARHIYIGANAVDYSGYPDCRPEYLQAFEYMANLATKAATEGQPLKLHAPLVSWTKARIIQEGVLLGIDYSLTVSCYQANVQGRACGHCDSCRLRRQGFEAVGIPDPTHYL